MILYRWVFTDLCLRLGHDFLYRTNANQIDLDVWKDLLNEVMNQISSLFALIISEIFVV